MPHDERLEAGEAELRAQRLRDERQGRHLRLNTTTTNNNNNNNNDNTDNANNTNNNNNMIILSI